jgi:hypothetical protein
MAMGDGRRGPKFMKSNEIEMKEELKEVLLRITLSTEVDGISVDVSDVIKALFRSVGKEEGDEFLEGMVSAVRDALERVRRSEIN